MSGLTSAGLTAGEVAGGVGSVAGSVGGAAGSLSSDLLAPTALNTAQTGIPAVEGAATGASGGAGGGLGLTDILNLASKVVPSAYNLMKGTNEAQEIPPIAPPTIQDAATAQKRLAETPAEIDARNLRARAREAAYAAQKRDEAAKQAAAMLGIIDAYGAEGYYKKPPTAKERVLGVPGVPGEFRFGTY